MLGSFHKVVGQPSGGSAEGFRLGCLVAQNAQVVGGKRMVDDGELHELSVAELRPALARTGTGSATSLQGLPD